MEPRWRALLVDTVGLLCGMAIGWVMATWLGFSVANPKTGAIGAAAIGLAGGAGLAFTRRWRERRAKTTTGQDSRVD